MKVAAHQNMNAKDLVQIRCERGAAICIARAFGLSEGDVKLIRRAALLHDIGKLGIPNEILEKPGALNEQEWKIVHQHPYYSSMILRRVPGFDPLSELVACHHEKLDGSGYYRKLKAQQLSMPARILAVAEIFDSLVTKRPYRDALPMEEVFHILNSDVPRALDGDCVEALKCHR